MTAEQSNLPPGGDLLDGEWLSTEDFATLLGVDSSTIRRWRTARPTQGPPFVRLSSRVTVYSTSDLRWLPFLAPRGSLGRERGYPCQPRSARPMSLEIGGEVIATAEFREHAAADGCARPWTRLSAHARRRATASAKPREPFSPEVVVRRFVGAVPGWGLMR